MLKIKYYLNLARINQWVKNAFVFLPIFFAGGFFQNELLIPSIFAFFVFCFASSTVYVINDLSDIEKDKKHPEKKFRPLASGKLNKTEAVVFLLFLFSVSSSLGFIYLDKTAFLLIGIYFLFNLAYSFGLKNTAILDVNIVAVGFVLRVLVGGFATDLPVSKWAILLTYGLALILVLGKRRGEIANLSKGSKTRAVLSNYSIEMLNIALAIVCSFTITFYVLYTVSDHAAELYGKGYDYLYLSVIFVVMGVLRYLQQTFVFERTESPTKFLFNDVFLQIVILAWILFFGLIIYYF